MTSQKVAILLWQTRPDDPERCATPFVYAAVAGAMDCQVEMHFSGPSVHLLVPGVAELIFPGSEKIKSIYQFMQDAAEQGAIFIGCSMAEREHLATTSGRIPEYRKMAGAAAFLQRTLDPEWRTMVF